MNLPLFFNHITAEVLVDIDVSRGVASWVDFHTKENLPEWNKADIAIFSINEYRGNQGNRPMKEDGGVMIRKYLYNLEQFSEQCKIADLGELRAGHYAEETQLRLAEVCETLLNHNTLPIIIGGSHDLDYGQFMGYQNMEKLISVLQIDSRIDLLADKPPKRYTGGDRIVSENEAIPEVTAKNHLQHILMHKPNYLFDFSHLGHQRFLNSKKSLETIMSLNFELKGLGEVKANLSEIEPIIRMADMLSFDISAIKKQDAMGNIGASPFGLTGEEACQICWYAGMNEKLTSLGLYEYNADLDKEGHTASTIAIMLWYFIEGYCYRQEEYSFNSNFHIKYLVQMPDELPDLVFYKSKVTEKWWMEVGTVSASDSMLDRPHIIPCSYTDYEAATSGEPPERWIKAQAKAL